MLTICIATALLSATPLAGEGSLPLFESFPAPTQETLRRGGQADTRIPYTYLETGFGHLSGFSAAGIDVSANLYSLGGAMELTEVFHIFGGGSRALDIHHSPEILENPRLDTWYGGIGIHDYVSKDVNGFLRVSYAGADVRGRRLDNGENYFLSSNGWVYSGGLRYFLWGTTELSISALRSNKGGSQWSFELGALYRVTESLGLGLVYTRPEKSEEGDNIGLGARWYF